MSKITTKEDIEQEFIWLNSMLSNSHSIPKSDLMNIAKEVQDALNSKYSKEEVDKDFISKKDALNDVQMIHNSINAMRKKEYEQKLDRLLKELDDIINQFSQVQKDGSQIIHYSVVKAILIEKFSKFKSQSNHNFECPICHNPQDDNYMCKKCIPKYNKEAYECMKRQEERSQSTPKFEKAISFDGSPCFINSQSIPEKLSESDSGCRSGGDVHKEFYVGTCEFCNSDDVFVCKCHGLCCGCRGRNLSFCRSCYCMTTTVVNKCVECGAIKGDLV